MASTEEGTLASVSISKRSVDVRNGKMFDVVLGGVYHARLGFFDPCGTARCVFVLEPEHLFSTTILGSMKIWEKHYLTQDIGGLRLDLGEIEMKQMVVTVDRDKQQVRRGFFLGARAVTGTSLIYFVDSGLLEEVPTTSLYATTELVAETRFMGFPCVLDSVDLFTGTKCLKRVLAMDDVKLEPNTLCKVVCNGFFNAEPAVPVVDFWPVKDKTSIIRSMSQNRVIANECIKQWFYNLELNKKHLPGTTLDAVIAHVGNDSKVYLHVVDPEEGDTLAVFMDAYLAKFDVGALQAQFPPLTKEAAKKGRENGTVYVAVFAEDGLLYRAKIIDIPDEGEEGVVVGFLDFGNMASVPFGKIFEAGLIDTTLELLPPLVYETFLAGIKDMVDLPGATELLQSQCDQIRVADGVGDLPLISVWGRKEDGTEYNLNEILLTQELARP